MSTRTTAVLLALLVGLGGLAYFTQGPGSPDRSREHEPLLPGLRAADVATIRATGAGADLLLARAAGGWTLGAAREPADAAAVEALLAGFAGTQVGAVVSTNVAKQSAYEADPGKGIAVRLEAAGGKSLAAFVVGAHGPDFASCYVRREGASEVLLVTRDLRADLSRPVGQWREPPKAAGEPGAVPPVPPPAKP